MTEKSRTVNKWYAAFTKATDFDSWGQLVEAAEEYNGVAKELHKFTAVQEKMFQDDQKKLILKIALCLDLRSKTLLQTQATAGQDPMTYDDIKKVGEVLRNLIVGWHEPFPVRVEVPTRSATVDEDSPFHEEVVLAGEGGTLLPRIPYEEGFHRLTVRIDRIGLKDAESYINSYFSVHVKDSDCVVVASSQDTPVSNRKEGSYVVFGIEVEIQKHIEKFPKGTAVFFEFKHYKPKKNIISTKCFGFMEQDEIRSGPACIELYQKPTDFRRKKLNLLTSKPLYLHLTLTIHDE
ncbi:axin interactor, dorsalization-associated protein [Nematostella vectensis]|uniref:axin interactor, dorsalization-associated protein n=1 Tax=Nematostella vectensis TaxID=45351 RepID=UPI00207717CF|nr:axin interactor, dorsalization-associated protein [Nematostella vectensis]